MKVTVAVPPVHTDGATVLLLVKTPLQPPLADAVASQAANFTSIWDWVWQAASVTLAGQLSTKAGAAATVKVALQVTSAWQLLSAINIIVVVLPHAEGVPVLLFVNTRLHPPAAMAVASQALYLLVIAG